MLRIFLVRFFARILTLSRLNQATLSYTNTRTGVRYQVTMTRDHLLFIAFVIGCFFIIAFR
jgi:hypothetical protein